MSKPPIIFLFISEVGQNRKQVLSGIQNTHIEKFDEENFKKIIHEKYELIIPNSFSSNQDEQQLQQQIKKLADQNLKVQVIFITIRYERLDMMNFRLITLIKYFQPYINNICLIITDFHKSQKKEIDYETINRKLAVELGILLLFGYYQKDNQGIFFERNNQLTTSNQFFEKLQFKYKSQIQLDGNKMGVYPQIDYKLLEKLQYRFKSMDPKQMLGKLESQKDNELQNQFRIQSNKQEQLKKSCQNGQVNGYYRVQANANAISKPIPRPRPSPRHFGYIKEEQRKKTLQLNK